MKLAKTLKELKSQERELESLYRPFISKCCGAGLRVGGNVTRYYICTKCNKACDIIEKA